MDTKKHYLSLVIELDMIGVPDVCIFFNDQELFNGSVQSPIWVYWTTDLAPGVGVLTIEHKNKSSDDPDTELIIKSIQFNGIASPKFVWQGVYTPDYPEPWATEQHQAGRKLAPTLSNVTHLSWNGKWTLTFTIPIFTWIHQIEDLGWIHQ